MNSRLFKRNTCVKLKKGTVIYTINKAFQEDESTQLTSANPVSLIGYIQNTTEGFYKKNGITNTALLKINVLWENGTTNFYHPTHLEVVTGVPKLGYFKGATVEVKGNASKHFIPLKTECKLVKPNVVTNYHVIETSDGIRRVVAQSDLLLKRIKNTKK